MTDLNRFEYLIFVFVGRGRNPPPDLGYPNFLYDSLSSLDQLRSSGYCKSRLKSA